MLSQAHTKRQPAGRQQRGTPVPLTHVRAPQAAVAELRLLQRLAAGTGGVRPAEILALQRVAGNRAVAQALRRAPTALIAISRLGGVRRRVQRYELLDKGVSNWKSGTSEGLFGRGGRSGYQAVDAAFTKWDNTRVGVDAKASLDALKNLIARIKDWQSAKSWVTSGKKAGKLLQEAEEELPKQEAMLKIQNKHKFAILRKPWSLGELSAIETGLDAYQLGYDLLKAGTDYPLKLAGFNKLKPALATWMGGKGSFAGKKPWLTDLMQGEIDKATIAVRINTKYGIKLDQQAGIDAIKAQYTNVPGAELNKLKARDWTLEELQDLETSLGKYAGLLGANRDVTKFGAQTLTTFSRLEQAIDKNTAGGKLDTTTLGETFTGSGNVSMFDVKTKAFAANKAAPTPDEIRKGYRAVIAHELSHALIEQIKSGSTTIIAKYATLFGFWNGKLYKSSYWRDKDGKKINVGGYSCDFEKSKAAAKKYKLEPPVTHYGMTNAKEDLAETMSHYLEAEAKLLNDCPKRHKFVKNNIAPLLKAP